IQENWGWVGTDLSESASITEDRMAIRILTDLSVFTSGLKATRPATGFSPRSRTTENLSHKVLMRSFNEAPGLIADKLKSVLERVWEGVRGRDCRGIVFAYD